MNLPVLKSSDTYCLNWYKIFGGHKFFNLSQSFQNYLGNKILNDTRVTFYY